jgi:ketosteroid isomerase-like protein
MMSEQQNIEIVQRGYEAFGRGDIETLMTLLDRDVQWDTPGPAELPTSGRRRGLEQVRGFFHTLNETFEIQRFEPKTFLSQGEIVVVLGDDTARIRATGKMIVTPWVHAFTLKDGKVTRFQEYLDTAPFVAELQAVHTRV